MIKRLAKTIGAGIGGALLMAIVVALLDLYLTGHGYPSATREIISWPAAGIRMSAGDIAVLLAFCAAALTAWSVT